MPNNDQWITSRITEARNDHRLVTESVAARMEELLNGQIREGLLSRTELRDIAKDLVARMAPEPQEKDEARQ